MAKPPVPPAVTAEEVRTLLVCHRRHVPFHELRIAAAGRTRPFATTMELLTAAEVGTS